MIQILFLFLSLLRLTSAQAQGEDELFASVGVGSASIRGFSWTYDIENPDLTDPVGKIYWVLTNDGVSLTAADIRAEAGGSNSQVLNSDPTNCAGSTTQEDEAIHQERMDCAMTAGTTYRFWVAVDYNGDGTQEVNVTPGGVPIQPQEDRDCDGFWSSCDANCIQTYTITQYPTGDGAGCEIGDEEERDCSPGTDDCPPATVSGEYDVANPTSDGFDILFTPDDTANTAAGKWYWMVTPTGATPTAQEVADSNGGLCGGSFSITSTAQVTETVDCKSPAGTYDVWVSEDPQGDGNPVLITPMKTVDIPGAAPVAHLFAHTQTPTGYKMSYDIDNPNPAGKYYFLTQPSGSPTPSAGDVMGAPAPCGGSYATDDSGAMKTVDVPCPLTPGDYEVWAVVDSDSAGGDVSFANDGVAFTFTLAAPGATNEPTVVPVPVTSPVPAPAPATMGYRVIAGGSYCETDQANTFQTLDVIQLPNVMVTTPTGAIVSDIVQCAANVQANRNLNGGCSTIFHSGGPTGICACVRLGYMCDEDESEAGQSIFQLCPVNNCAQMIGVIDLQKVHAGQQLMLQAPHSAQTETPSSGNKGFELYGVPVLYYFLAMLCGVISGMAVYYIVCGTRRKQEDITEDFYHIALDTQEQE